MPRVGFNWAPRIGRIRGLSIRFHLTLGLLIAYWLVQGLLAYPGDRVAGLARAAIMSGALLVIIVWHELGHAWAARRSGLGVEGILLWPLGGECQIAGRMPSPRTEILVALAGPAAHALLVAAAFGPLVYLLPLLDRFDPLTAANGLIAAWWLGFWVLVFNLIPAFPLDGGLALRGLLTYRLGEVRATRAAARIGQVFAGLYFIAGLAYGSMLLGFLAVYIFIGAEQELRAVLAGGTAYDPGARDPYFQSLGVREDWSAQAAPEKAGLWKRLVIRWRLGRLARETERREQLKIEVDRILEKVSREGLPALSARERKVLNQASGEYRKQQ
jgi:Zn-dependent protease